MYTILAVCLVCECSEVCNFCNTERKHFVVVVSAILCSKEPWIQMASAAKEKAAQEESSESESGEGLFGGSSSDECTEYRSVVALSSVL